jgi:predicted amidophosphoribosyltransferase
MTRFRTWARGGKAPADPGILSVPADRFSRMFCWGCGTLAGSISIPLRRRDSDPFCSNCRAGLSPAPARLVAGITVWSAYLHRGPAKHLVHALKFGGVEGAADVMARLLVDKVPSVSCLVPIPRSTARRIIYGVDAARTLAFSLRRLTGLAVVDALAASPMTRPHTGMAANRRPHPGFGRLRSVPVDALLVDDVVTTGSTLEAAAALTGSRLAMTFTSATK